jgi:hypothetical protein
VLAAVLVFSFSTSVSAQDSQDQKHWKPQEDRVDLNGFLTEGGLVNFIEGEATYVHPGAAEQKLKVRQALENGDAIETGQTGRSEILLNPSYYLRMSANTRIVFLDLSPNNLKLKITRGAAIVEMCMIDWLWATTWEPDPSHSSLYEPITVLVPQSDVGMVTGGIYRFAVDRSGSTELKVTKGRAFIAGNRVEGGMSATFRNGSTAVTKFNKEQGDAFDNWSHERADLLVKANQSLKNTSWHKVLRKNPLSYLKIDDDERHERFKESRTVAAFGGYVNFVEPGSFIKSEDSDWTEFSAHAALKYGDRIKTSPDSRAEIAVYPTCSLFIGSDTEVIFGVRPDGDAAVRLLRGSAIIYLYYGEKDKDERPVITFAAPQLEYEIVRDGVYQLSVTPDVPEMKVYWGRVKVAGREVKEDKKIVFRRSGLEISDLSKKARDSFYVWSQKRASFSYARTHRVELYGMWYFDNAAGSYTLVSGRYNFHSPYGGEYRVGFSARGRR